VTERAAELTVDALCEMGLLEWVDGGVEPTNRMLGFVTKTDVRSIGRLPRTLDVADALAALPETMQSGQPPAVGEWEVRNRLGAAAARDDAEVRAAVTAAVREHPDASSVLVVGDDAGQYAVEFATRGFDVAFRHRPRVLDKLRPPLAPEPVELVPGDPRERVDPDRPVDLVFLPHVVREYGPDDVQRVFASAAGAVADDGGIAVVDAFEGSPGLTAELLATTEAGECHDAGRVREWVADAGFESVASEAVPGTGFGVVVGSRRAVQ
jgi:hypothetical protein